MWMFNLELLFQLFVSVKGINGAGLSSVSTSNGVYLSYLSQGRPPLTHIGVIDMTDGETVDMWVSTLLFSLLDMELISWLRLITNSIFLIFKEKRLGERAVEIIFEIFFLILKIKIKRRGITIKIDVVFFLIESDFKKWPIKH